MRSWIGSAFPHNRAVAPPTLAPPCVRVNHPVPTPGDSTGKAHDPAHRPTRRQWHSPRVRCRAPRSRARCTARSSTGTTTASKTAMRGIRCASARPSRARTPTSHAGTRPFARTTPRLSFTAGRRGGTVSTSRTRQYGCANDQWLSFRSNGPQGAVQCPERPSSPGFGQSRHVRTSQPGVSYRAGDWRDRKSHHANTTYIERHTPCSARKTGNRRMAPGRLDVMR